MADDADPVSSPIPEINKCFIHFSIVNDVDLKEFTDTTWSKVLASAEILKDAGGEKGQIATDLLAVPGANFAHGESCTATTSHASGSVNVLITKPSHARFHRQCYQKFTDKRKLEQAQRKRKIPQDSEKTEFEEPSDIPLQPKKPCRDLRSRRSSASFRRSEHVLPSECIICQKVIKDVYKRGKRTKETLTSCQYVDGGKLLQQAINEQNNRILRLIQKQDCVAIEVKYHATCFRKFTRPLTRKENQQPQPDRLYSVSFNKFCKDVIEDKLIADKKVWELISLKRKFVKIVKDVENKDIASYKTYNLKRRLQNLYPSLRFVQPKNRNESEIVFINDLSTESLFTDDRASIDEPSDRSDTDTDSEEDSFFLQRARGSEPNLRERYTSALVLKKEINDIPKETMPWPPNSSHLNQDKAESIVPMKLYNFLAWMTGLSGEPTDEEFVLVSEDKHRRILSISQDVIYLASKGRKPMPKHTSLAMAVRHLTGSAQLIGILNGFGHATSHTSALEHDTALAKKEIRTGRSKLPSCLQESIFTTLVWDNNDFGEETLSGRGTTHNTNGIAIQHRPAASSRPVDSTDDRQETVKKTRERTLQAPEERLVPFFGKKKASPSSLGSNTKLEKTQHAAPVIRARKSDDGYFITKSSASDDGRLLPGWTGYNQMLITLVPPKATIAYLPVIDASPTEMNAVNTILHRSIEIADSLKLGSVVVVVDQAIYAKAQSVRWQTPLFMDRIVLRLGAFHTAMTFLACIGTRFRDAGLEDILIESEVLAGGSVNGVMNGRHYNRSIRCHKLMSEALHLLRWQSFMDSITEDEAKVYKDFIGRLQDSFPSQIYADKLDSDEFDELMKAYAEYIEEKKKTSGTFAFWCSYVDMVDTLLQFTRATREGNWDLHLAAIRAMLPWMFSYNRTNYSRYLPIYWMEMHELTRTHPDIHEEFQDGNFAVQRQDAYGFAGVPCDQTIEQTVNRDSKTRGGLKGFTVNKGAVSRWTVGHHERAAIMRQCEDMAGKGQRAAIRKDLTEGRMKRDKEDVQRIMETVTSLTNPFEDVTSTCSEIVHLASGVVASSDVSTDLMVAEVKGDAAFTSYCQERLQSNDKSIQDTLPKSKLKTFSSLAKRSTSRVNGKEVVLKSDRDLFARLVIIGKTRQIDLRNMMTYSLGPLPLALAKNDGCLMKTNKARLLHILEDLSPPSDETASESEIEPCQPPKGGIWIVDGMALLQQMNTKKMPKTVGQVAVKIMNQLLNMCYQTQSSCIHFVTDTYPEHSIKNAGRKRRAASGSQRVKITRPDQNTPKQWKKFLANSHNKQQWVNFLITEWQKYNAEQLKGIQLVVAHDDKCHMIAADTNGTVMCTQVDALCSDHEEADTRMLLHAKYIADTTNSTPAIIRSPDTDVFVLAVALSQQISSPLYFYTGKEDKARTIDVRAVQQQLGDELTDALISFHAFTGCDSVSSFYGKGKQKAFNLLRKNTVYAQAFKELGNALDVPVDVSSALERFLCVLYGHKDVTSVNEVRYIMLKTATRMESIMPPNQDSLKKHIQRANFQTSIFKKSLEPIQDMPSPVTNGWKMDGNDLVIDWMDLAPAPDSVLELAFCKCKKSKCILGKADEECCVNRGLVSTDLCQCNKCDNMELHPDENLENEEADDEAAEDEAAGDEAEENENEDE